MSAQDKHRRAREAATKALALDPQLGEPHAALAGVLLHANWNFAGTERGFLLAIELISELRGMSPGALSHLLLFLGRAEDWFRRTRRKFLELESDIQTPIGHLAYHYLHTRQYQEAIEQRSLQADRNLYPDAANVSELGDAYYFRGLHREAVDEYLHGLAANGVLADRLNVLKRAFATTGMPGSCEHSLRTSKPDQTHRRSYSCSAPITRGSATRTARSSIFEQSYKARAPNLVTLKENPSFDTLSADPGFGDLLRRVGLPRVVGRPPASAHSRTKRACAAEPLVFPVEAVIGAHVRRVSAALEQCCDELPSTQSSA